MSFNTEHKAAARQLLKMNKADMMRLLCDEHNVCLHEDEVAKTHALESFTLDVTEWDKFKAHMLDGGGVLEDGDIARLILTALMDDNQVEFWKHLPHLVKHWLKVKGHIEPIPNSTAVKFNGVAKTRPETIIEKKELHHVGDQSLAATVLVGSGEQPGPSEDVQRPD